MKHGRLGDLVVTWKQVNVAEPASPLFVTITRPRPSGLVIVDSCTFVPHCTRACLTLGQNGGDGGDVHGQSIAAAAAGSEQAKLLCNSCASAAISALRYRIRIVSPIILRCTITVVSIPKQARVSVLVLMNMRCSGGYQESQHRLKLWHCMQRFPGSCILCACGWNDIHSLWACMKRDCCWLSERAMIAAHAVQHC